MPKKRSRAKSKRTTAAKLNENTKKIVTGGVFAAVGVALLIGANAADRHLEAESASRNELATVKSDATASNGKYVEFLEPSLSTPQFPGDPRPQEKIYWGASQQGNGDPTDYHEAATGKTLSVRRTFYQWHHHDNPSNDYLYRVVKDDHASNRLPWVSTKTPPWQEMARGDHDARIDQLLRTLDSYGKPVWLTFHHEPEGGGGVNYPDDPGGAAAWRGMQVRVRDRMNALGTENIAFAPILMSWTWNDKSGRNPDAWWVDGIWDFYGIDFYKENATSMITGTSFNNFSQFFKDRNMAIAYGEWGNKNHSESGATAMREFWEHGFDNNMIAYAYYDTIVNGGKPLSDKVLVEFRSILKDPRVQRPNDLDEGNTGPVEGVLNATVSVPASDTYRTWVRMRSDSPNATTIGVKVGANNEVTMAANSTNASEWSWVDHRVIGANNKVDFALNEGDHSLRIRGIDAGVQVDRVLLLSNNCTPVDTGDNCTVVSPETFMEVVRPENNTELSGVATISGNSSEDINAVALRVDNKWVKTDRSLPYTFSLDTTKYEDGTHSLVLRGWSKGGTKTDSEVVTFTVNNTTNENGVQITNLSRDQVVKGDVSVASNVTGKDIVAVSLRIDGKWVETARSEPFNTSFNSRSYSNGRHQVLLRGWDNSGNSYDSSVVTVRVSN